MKDINRIMVDEKFIESAYDDLPDIIKTRSPNLVKLILLSLTGLDDIQKLIVQVSNSTLMSNAQGDALDKKASRYFVQRNGRDDNTLKGAIKLKTLSSTSTTSRDDVVGLLELISGGKSGIIAVNKLMSGNLQIVISAECLELSKLSVDMEGLFPLRTNLELLSSPASNVKKVFAFSSESVDDADRKNCIGVFSSRSETQNKDETGRFTKKIFSTDEGQQPLNSDIEPIFVVAQKDQPLPVSKMNNKIKPNSVHTANGYDSGETLSAENFNYILNNLGAWLKYLLEELENKRKINLGLERVISRHQCS